MFTKYHYYKSSVKEAKHEISRKEFIKLLGESGHCVDRISITSGISMDVANYKKAENQLRSAQRSSRSTLWSCGHYTLYLEHERGNRVRGKDGIRKGEVAE